MTAASRRACVEQQGQPERQEEPEDWHRERPDEAGPEQPREDVVLHQPDVVVEPVELVVQLVAGLGVVVGLGPAL
jgi:hypothetical protein